MLINTVILFLRDALPVFIFMSLLASLGHASLTEKKPLAIALASGALGALIIVNSANYISHLFDGAGMELLTSLITMMFYLLASCLVVLLDQGRAPVQILGAIIFSAILLTTSINGASFLVFLTGYWSQYGTAQPLILGIVLGLGISTSFSILLYFLLGWLRSIGLRNAHHVLIVLFAAGQLAQTVNLLSQVDVITDSPNLWDTGQLISDNSEAGYVLASLFGYEASPSLVQVLVNITAVLLPLLAIIILRVWQTPTTTNEKGGSQ
jgi:high-affinity iron transporter